MALAATAQLNAVLVEREDLADHLAIMRFAPEGWRFEEFEAGQFAVLGLPGSAPRCADALPEEKPVAPDRLVRRAYSIASSPAVHDHLEFYLLKVPNGALTPRLFALGVGDRVFMSKAGKGQLTLSTVPENARIAMLATGTGLAPYMSMLRRHLAESPDRKFLLAHGVRRRRDLGYRAELEELDRRHENFRYFPVLSEADREPEPWSGRRGRLDAAWKNRLAEEAWGAPASAHDTHVYLCGNPLMVEGMTAILTAEGFAVHGSRTPGQIHVEVYW